MPRSASTEAAGEATTKGRAQRPRRLAPLTAHNVEPQREPRVPFTERWMPPVTEPKETPVAAMPYETPTPRHPRCSVHLISSAPNRGHQAKDDEPAVAPLLVPHAAAATLAPSKGRLMRCTVPGLTPNRTAILRTPSVRPGLFKASWIRFSSSGAIGGRPSSLPSERARARPAREG
jgi:hypothetical protein